MATKSIEPNKYHTGFMNEMKRAMRKHGKNLTAEELLAIAAQLVGNLIALQDQRKYTSEMVMQIVSENIMIGNDTAVQGLMNEQGTA